MMQIFPTGARFTRVCITKLPESLKHDLSCDDWNPLLNQLETHVQLGYITAL